MRFKCNSCNFELNLNIKSLPKNARLYCPKCKAILTSMEESVPPPTPIEQFSAPQARIESAQTAPQPSATVSSPWPSPAQNSTPFSGPIQSSRSSEQDLFSEDLKPELEMQSEEVIQKTREELFSKPENIWYDSSVQPPPVPPQVAVPPPIPPATAVPPPIPQNVPPPLPFSAPAPQSGYVSASSSIQIDSSLITPDAPKIPISTPSIPEPPSTPFEEKIELATEVSTPAPATIATEEKLPAPQEEKVEKVKRGSTADKGDVILLTTQAHPPRRISITLPAISLIVLACIAGFIYYQIVVSSSKTEFIKDLKSTPTLGAIPPPTQTNQNKSDIATSNPQDNQSSSSTKSSKVPIKAKRSALEHYKRGNQYFMETKYEQARDEYAMAIAADPTFGLAYRGLGTTYAKLGQPDLAVKNYEKYIELMPNATDAEQVKSIIKQYYGK